MASLIEDDADTDFLTGRLLVAMPGIDDERFERTVLYLCAHDEEQAMGVAVNRPIDGLSVFELLDRLGVKSEIQAPGDLVLLGGRSSANAALSCTPTTSTRRTRPCRWPTAWA